LTVDSGEFILAVPDFSHFARDSPSLEPSQAQETTSFNIKETSTFKKVVMKLSGKVRWQAGLMFERELGNGRRSFEFEPHYNVTLKNPHHIKAIKNDVRARKFYATYMLIYFSIITTPLGDSAVITSTCQLPYPLHLIETGTFRIWSALTTTTPFISHLASSLIFTHGGTCSLE